MEASLAFLATSEITWFSVQGKADQEMPKGWLQASQPLPLSKITVLGDEPQLYE